MIIIVLQSSAWHLYGTFMAPLLYGTFIVHLEPASQRLFTRCDR